MPTVYSYEIEFAHLVELFWLSDLTACDCHVDLVIQTCRGTERELTLILAKYVKFSLCFQVAFCRSFKDMFV